MAEASKNGRKKEGTVTANYEKLGYHQKDVVSSLIKSLRLGDIESCYYWFQLMTAVGESYYHIARILINFAYEDCYEDSAIMISDACWRSMMIQKQRGMTGNTPFWWIDRLCRAKKFWECEEGRKREKIWWRVEDEIRLKGFTRPIPSWALDRHSFTAWKTKEFDERFSGNRWGRLNMCAAFERDGKLDPEGKPALKDK